MRVLVALALLGGAASADNIRVDVGMTGSSVSVADRNAVGVVTEIKVNAHDNVAIGGRVEVAAMFGGLVNQEELPFGIAAAALLKGEYLLGAGHVRPFAGLGAGLYSIGSHTIADGGISTTAGRYFGLAPEVGVDAGRVRLAATYNAVLGTSVEYRQTTGGMHRESFSQSYLSLELSFRFGSRSSTSAR
jgi:outer membrane protein X